jgi:hypothetical protein
VYDRLGSFASIALQTSVRLFPEFRHVRRLSDCRDTVRRFRVDAGALPYSAFTSSNSTILVAPVIGTITPGDLTIILLPSTRMKYTRSVS